MKRDQRYILLENILSDELKERNLQEKETAYSSNTRRNLSKEDAATIIQKIWWTFKLAKKFAKHRHQGYISLLKQQGETFKRPQLSELMYDRTIATQIKLISNPYINDNAFYHRSDDLTGGLIVKLIGSFDPDENHQKYTYIPIYLLASSPIMAFLDQHLPELKPEIEILFKDEHNVALIKIEINHLEQKTLLNKLQAGGLIASPWEISKSYERVIRAPSANPALCQTDSGEFKKLCNHYPKNISALIQSKLLYRLGRLAISKNSPNRVLAACLHRMIRGLAQIEVPQTVIERIALFLSLALYFNSMNYRQFANNLRDITHEISLVLNMYLEKQQSIVTFDQFKRETINNAINYFNLGDDLEEHAVNVVAAPALSGTNAYLIAMNLATRMITAQNRKPTIKILGSNYYEFNYLHSNTSNIVLNGQAPNIYLLSIGPIVDESGLQIGMDINQTIKETQDNHNNLPVTLVIDATTGLYENFKLNDASIKLVNTGLVSLIVYESHQKFGLVHTDQAQYGRLFALCAKDSFPLSVITELEDSAAKDLRTLLDMQIGAYFSISCSKYLEEIKKIHFANGSVYNNVINTLEIFDKSPMQGRPDQRYFYVTDLAKCNEITPLTPFDSRDSFGHYMSSISRVTTWARFSPAASDTLDTLLELTELALVGLFAPQERIELLLDLSKATLNRMTLENKLITTALALNLFKPQISLKKVQHPGVHISPTKKCLSLNGTDYSIEYNKTLAFPKIKPLLYLTNYLLALPSLYTKRNALQKLKNHQHDLKKNLLYLAAKHGDPNILIELLQKEKTTGFSLKRKNNALSAAFSCKHVACIELLLLHGAAPNDNISHWHPNPMNNILAWSCLYGHARITKLLLDKGIDSNIYWNRESILHMAAYEGCIDVIHALSASGFNMDIYTFEHGTPLMLAAKQGKLNVVETLLSEGANINYTNYFGQTAATYAALYQKTEILRFLLIQGASIDLTKEAYRDQEMAVVTQCNFTELMQLLNYGNITTKHKGRALALYKSLHKTMKGNFENCTEEQIEQARQILNKQRNLMERANHSWMSFFRHALVNHSQFSKSGIKAERALSNPLSSRAPELLSVVKLMQTQLNPAAKAHPTQALPHLTSLTDPTEDQKQAQHSLR